MRAHRAAGSSSPVILLLSLPTKRCTSGTEDDQHQYQICTINKTYTPFIYVLRILVLFRLMRGLLWDGLLFGLCGSPVPRGGEGEIHEMARDAG
uniref:Putative secreted protein n=1 Tax=Anopheles marajoara TaxID=58244 RepID=A0A2M4C9J3_9DIPT